MGQPLSTFFWSLPKQNGKNQYIYARIDFVRSNPNRISTIESLQELNPSSFTISSDIRMENMGKPLSLLEARIMCQDSIHSMKELLQCNLSEN
jgi:hypothetical protein